MERLPCMLSETEGRAVRAFYRNPPIDKTKELGLLWQQIESGVERRAEYVLEKFGTTHTGLDAIRDYAPENMAKANDSEHEAGKRIETSNSLIFEGSATYNASVTKHDSKREVNNKNTERHMLACYMIN